MADARRWHSPGQLLAIQACATVIQLLLLVGLFLFVNNQFERRHKESLERYRDVFKK